VYVSDLGKAKRDLGWEPLIGVEQGLDDLRGWVDANRELFEGGMATLVHPPEAGRVREMLVEDPRGTAPLERPEMVKAESEATMDPVPSEYPVLLPRLSAAERTARMKAVRPAAKETAR
jgi:hypothetical protein